MDHLPEFRVLPELFFVHHDSPEGVQALKGHVESLNDTAQSEALRVMGVQPILLLKFVLVNHCRKENWLGSETQEDRHYVGFHLLCLLEGEGAVNAPARDKPGESQFVCLTPRRRTEIFPDQGVYLGL